MTPTPFFPYNIELYGVTIIYVTPPSGSMALGELYRPKGLAKETAQVVLGVDDPFAINVAIGCSNDCPTCYGPLAFKKKDWGTVRVANLKNVLKVKDAILKYHPQGVFLSFTTDPCLEVNLSRTMFIMGVLIGLDVKYATLSKMAYSGTSDWKGHMTGKTIVSLDDKYWKVQEPNANPPKQRLISLKKALHPWISCEPYPPPAVHDQDPRKFLEDIKQCEPELIIFGKLNYDRRSITPEARTFYREVIPVFRDFCRSEGIRLHVKSDTMKFVGEL